ncbi:MAG: NUDIX hydrolase N-terminal domain-containing protein [Prevotellaceae bacterium]|jgi:hypothetical protein|nr:NUDIX hydrolase N-terminal domain-containing protein [Prevotellaceae bacterium]
MSQTALAYSTDEYEIDRNKKLIAISNRIISIVRGAKEENVRIGYPPVKKQVISKVDIRVVIFNE